MKSVCKFCKGTGHLVQQRNGITRTTLCPYCRGKTKKVINYNKCIYCGGTGYITGCCGEKTIECEACKNT